MKKLIMTGLVGMSLLAACKQNPENGGEEIRGNEQRTDTPMNISSYPNEGAADSGGVYGDPDVRNPNTPEGQGQRSGKGTFQDSQKSKANPLYKGDNSDTGRVRK